MARRQKKKDPPAQYRKADEIYLRLQKKRAVSDAQNSMFYVFRLYQTRHGLTAHTPIKTKYDIIDSLLQG
jgi:hypothetical protein